MEKLSGKVVFVDLKYFLFFILFGIKNDFFAAVNSNVKRSNNGIFTLKMKQLSRAMRIVEGVICVLLIKFKQADF